MIRSPKPGPFWVGVFRSNFPGWEERRDGTERSRRRSRIPEGDLFLGNRSQFIDQGT